LVIRTCGERSLSLCKKSIEIQGKFIPVKILKESPFEKALKKSYRFGYCSRKKWTIVCDADVILFPRSINTLKNAAEKAPETVFSIQGIVYDEILRQFRFAGPRIYRTRFLLEASKLVPREGLYARPETEVLKRAEKAGLKSLNLNCLVGVHDAEQSLFDYFRKAFWHAIKHRDLTYHKLIKNYSKITNSPKNLIILIGFCMGLLSNNVNATNAKEFSKRLYFIKKTISQFQKIHGKKNNQVIEKVYCPYEKLSFKMCFYLYIGKSVFKKIIKFFLFTQK
jgi:hypothetical protein